MRSPYEQLGAVHCRTIRRAEARSLQVAMGGQRPLLRFSHWNAARSPIVYRKTRILPQLKQFSPTEVCAVDKSKHRENYNYNRHITLRDEREYVHRVRTNARCRGAEDRSEQR